MVQQDVLQVVEGGPLGDLEAGTVASLVSAEFSIVSGGLACIAGAALLTVLLRGFRRYRRRCAGQPGADRPASAGRPGDAPPRPGRGRGKPGAPRTMS